MRRMYFTAEEALLAVATSAGLVFHVPNECTLTQIAVCWCTVLQYFLEHKRLSLDSCIATDSCLKGNCCSGMNLNSVEKPRRHNRNHSNGPAATEA
jgi:hypothetical protein